MEKIPNDILAMIFSTLSVKDLCNLSLASHRFYMVTKKVWGSPRFNSLDNRIYIGKIYSMYVMNADTLMSVINAVNYNLDDESRKDFMEKCAPLMIEESITAACNTFTFSEISALTKLYCSDIGISITSKMNTFLINFKKGSSEKMNKVLKDFEEKHNLNIEIF